MFKPQHQVRGKNQIDDIKHVFPNKAAKISLMLHTSPRVRESTSERDICVMCLVCREEKNAVYVKTVHASIVRHMQNQRL